MVSIRMLRTMVLLHRWLGVAFCLLFAMWFATGIVMHFVPFPSLSDMHRFAGMAPIDITGIAQGPAAAVSASGIENALRVRLIQRRDGPVFVVSGAANLKALRAGDLASATVESPQLALAIARDYGGRRRLDTARAAVAGLANYDQWTVPNRYDLYRPLFRVAMKDADGTEIYVSSVTGEVVQVTVSRERIWNFVGSVAHWIYPTVLRQNWALWDQSVWTLSLAATIAAVLGAVLGVVKLKLSGRRPASPFRGWKAWHHVAGLFAAVFVITWIFSGWLSMDHGRLFSRGELTDDEAAKAAETPQWERASSFDSHELAPEVREVEWFGLEGILFRRERMAADWQVLFSDGAAEPRLPQANLSSLQVGKIISQFRPGCDPPQVVAANDNYPVATATPALPVYRLVCGAIWYHVDSASGRILERLDTSRRVYRWLYRFLHTFDMPSLSAHSTSRSVLIVSLCGFGLVFSLTGVVLGWRRLRLHAGGRTSDQYTNA